MGKSLDYISFNMKLKTEMLNLYWIYIFCTCILKAIEKNCVYKIIHNKYDDCLIFQHAAFEYINIYINTYTTCFCVCGGNTRKNILLLTQKNIYYIPRCVSHIK